MDPEFFIFTTMPKEKETINNNKNPIMVLTLEGIGDSSRIKYEYPLPRNIDIHYSKYHIPK